MNWFFDLFSDRTFGAKRSPRWSQVRAQHIALYPKCVFCNKKGKLLFPNSVHHKKVFHLHPELELDPKNLCTVCPRCHLIFAHLGSFQSFNETIDEDAKIWNEKITNRP